MNRKKNNLGFTLPELMVVMAIFTIMLAGVYAVLAAGQNAWLGTDAQIQMQQNLRLALEKVSKELHESGADGGGVLQVNINDGGGTSGSDILRFSIPVCVCADGIIDDNGNVVNWGAPLLWGTPICSNDLDDAIPDAQDKVTVCHIPPGNPENPQTLSVATSSLSAHIEHGDWLGECGTCSTDNNKFIQYRIGANNQLVRQILNSAATTIVREDVVAQNITDFQTSLSGDQNVVTLTITSLVTAGNNRQYTLTRSLNVRLRNKG